MTAPAVFSQDRWTKSHLGRDAESIVGRLVLIALGVLSEGGGRYTTVAQLSTATGFAPGLIEPVLYDAVDRGEVRMSGAKVWPVQRPVEVREGVRSAA